MRSFALLLGLLAALPLFAGGRTRAVKIVETPYYGRVTDAATGRGVVDAEIRSGSRLARSDASGNFTIPLPLGVPAELTIRRSGYDPVTTTVTASPGTGVIISPAVPPAPVAIPMTPRPPAVVTLAGGSKRMVDADSIEFGYILPFASPVASATASFCRTDGSIFTPDRSQIRRITGPAVRAQSAACCPNGQPLRVTLQTTASEAEERVFFTDSCAGYEMVLVARERESGQFIHIDFTTIQEVVIP